MIYTIALKHPQWDFRGDFRQSNQMKVKVWANPRMNLGARWWGGNGWTEQAYARRDLPNATAGAITL